MADFVGSITNLFMLGEENTDLANGAWRRDFTEIEFAGFNIELIQDPHVLTGPFNEYRGQTVITTQARIRNLPPERFEEAIDTINGMTELLSFAAVSEVALCGWEYAHPGQETISKRWNVISQAQFFRPIIEIRDGASVRMFLEETGLSYFQERHKRKLPIAIGYFVTPEVRAMPMEFQLLSMFIFYENLKSTYAATVGYSYQKGFYRKSDGSKWSFRDLLTEMFRAAGMSPRLDDLIILRNEIIHSGISTLDFNLQQDIYSSLRDIAREYLIRLLKYTGRYYRYSDQGVQAVTISNIN